MNIPINLSPQVETSLRSNGGPMAFSGQHGEYIVMRLDVYKAMLGLEDDDEAETLASARRGLADVDTGRTLSIDQAFARLESRHAS